MNYQKLIDEKHSVREYKNKAIKPDLLADIATYADSAKKLIKGLKVELKIVKNDGVCESLNGICGYKGIMIDAPYYAFLLSEKAEHYIENAGYIAEGISLKLFDEGVSSCFITFDEGEKVLSKLGISTDMSLVAILGFGYGKTSRGIFSSTKIGGNYSKAKFGMDSKESEKHSVTELVYDGHWGKEIEYDVLKNRMLDTPLFYSRLAPSSYNRQPWRFILDNELIVLALEKGESSYNNSVDAGIQMLYFDLVMSETLMDVDWILESPSNDYEIPENYEVIGYAKI